jgi:hypothetical protein
MSKPMKQREWRMEVLSLPKLALIHPLNLPHRLFLLCLGVLHLCCYAPGLPRPSGGSGRGRRGAAGGLDMAGRAATGLGVVDSSGWARQVQSHSRICPQCD